MIPWSPPDLLAEHPTGIAVLTPRQAQVLTGLCMGWSNKEIAKAHYLGVETVASYTTRLFRAMQARDRCHAVALATQLTIVIEDRTKKWSPDA